MPYFFIIKLKFNGEVIPLRVPISPAIALISFDLLDVQQYCDDFEAKGEAQPPTPGHTLQLNQAEQEARRELAMQGQSVIAHRARRAEGRRTQPTFKHPHGPET